MMIIDEDMFTNMDRIMLTALAEIAEAGGGYVV
jgi:hypothetical protein